MEFSHTLKKNYEFRRLYSRGKSAGTASIVVYTRKNRLGRNRYGITVSNKIGNAVQRNKIRRRLREIYRLHEPELRRGLDIVIVARTRSRFASYRELDKSFTGCMSRLGALAANETAKDKPQRTGGDRS